MDNPKHSKRVVSILLIVSAALSFSNPVLGMNRDKPRIIATTDGEIDDRCSMVRFLMYANEWDIEGIISSSKFHWKGHHWAGDDWVQPYLDAYAKVYPNLVKHDSRYPTPEYLQTRTLLGNVETEGDMDAITPGSQHIVRVLLDESDDRPVWLQAWGGPNAIARALKTIEEEHPEKMAYVANKIRFFFIWEQDSTYQAYIRPHWGKYNILTIISDQFLAITYHWDKILPPEQQKFFTGAWMKRHILQNHGPLCALYKAKENGDFRSEGDSPAFLHSRYDRELLGGIVVLNGKAWIHPASNWDNTLYRSLGRRKNREIDLGLIPCYAWDNRGESEMTVWMPLENSQPNTAMFILNSDDFKHHIDFFNTMEPENIVNFIPNSASWEWLVENIPFFECPDKNFEQIYYFRWWTFRKHLKKTADGFVFTEFLDNVGHSGKYNTISCALGHHIYEGTWLRDKNYIDDYARFWYLGNKGTLQPHFHKYSNWGTWALYRRYLVNQDKKFLITLLDSFIADYELWVKEKGLENGLFWQYDVRDGMEESISGSRNVKNARPTINSYMYASAKAISKIALMAERQAIANEYAKKAAVIKSRIHELLWDDVAKFFKVRYPDGSLADVREEIGFIPWYFNIPVSGCESAWKQLVDPEGFAAPMGITTAERRHPQFRSHGVGTCEWDGAVWPYATSQTLVSMANLLRNYNQNFVRREDYFHALMTYARSHQYRGKPYIGEYLDEIDGHWLKPDSDRSRYYNHSTFCDLVISGLVGLIPQEGNEVYINPLIPLDKWDWFCLDHIRYHGSDLTIMWDRHGTKYKKGKGLRVFADGIEIAYSEEITGFKCKLSK